MCCYVYRPQAPGRRPAVVLYSEIFQLTQPISRMAAMHAGNAYVVAVPEIFHELEPMGTVLASDQPGADAGTRRATRRPGPRGSTVGPHPGRPAGRDG